jgi:hypothetical protein
MAQQWSTLHIFGYGESQAIGKEYNKKTKTSSLTSAQAVIDNIYSKKPVDNNASAQYRVITIFNDFDGRFFPETGDSFSVKFSQLDASLCQSLVDEIYSLVPDKE